MPNQKLHSEFMPAIQDEASLRSVYWKFGIHPINIKELIAKFKSSQKDRVSKK